MRVIAAVIGLAVALCAALLLSDRVVRSTLFYPPGHITEGDFVGATVGRPSGEARQHLLGLGMRLEHEDARTSCYGRSFPHDATVELYVDRGVALNASTYDAFFRRGTVCVVSQGPVVQEIHWFYGGP
jgi:hypothetical protein